MDLLAQTSVTTPAPVVVHVYHWGHIAIAAGGVLLLVLLLVLLAVAAAAKFGRGREKAEE